MSVSSVVKTCGAGAGTAYLSFSSNGKYPACRIAEALITRIRTGKGFEDIYRKIMKLF